MKQGLTVAALLMWAMPAFAGTNHIFVSNERGNGLTVLNATDYSTVGFVKTGARPRGMLFSPDHKLLYVACGGVNRIDIVDVARMKVISHLGPIDDPETFDSHVLGSDGVPEVLGSIPRTWPLPIGERKVVVFVSAFGAELGRRKEPVYPDEVLCCSTGLYTRPGAAVRQLRRQAMISPAWFSQAPSGLSIQGR